MRQIKFTHTGHSAHPLVGNFSAEDTARLPADIAKHLVEEAGCAIYQDQPEAPAQADKPEASKETKPKKGGSK